jgi:hypothetical protein
MVTRSDSSDDAARMSRLRLIEGFIDAREVADALPVCRGAGNKRNKKALSAKFA